MIRRKKVRMPFVFLFEGETDDFDSGLFLMSALHSKNNFDGKSSFRQIL